MAMKPMIQAGRFAGIVLLAIGLTGCGVSKDEHQKVLSELEQTRAELRKTRAELEEANTKIFEIKKSFLTAQSESKIASRKYGREKKLMQAELVSARREAAILRQQMDELRESFVRATREAVILKEANEMLRAKINELEGLLKEGR